jgi:hypothetical protein
MSSGQELAREDMLQLIQSLIDSHQVRDILLKSLSPMEAVEMKP